MKEKRRRPGAKVHPIGAFNESEIGEKDILKFWNY